MARVVSQHFLEQIVLIGDLIIARFTIVQAAATPDRFERLGQFHLGLRVRDNLALAMHDAARLHMRCKPESARSAALACDPMGTDRFCSSSNIGFFPHFSVAEISGTPG